MFWKKIRQKKLQVKRLYNPTQIHSYIKKNKQTNSQMVYLIYLHFSSFLLLPFNVEFQYLMDSVYMQTWGYQSKA